uniref:RagB/SusD family nutrient uptake outer membrane protein n=1 Tax=Altererythrobacter segetis TaxID=1104773 RepID=UPI00140AB225|nr:RagB/SusD family nutrient uptake outer membrane protein [Altererythrobacter segetis]
MARTSYLGGSTVIHGGSGWFGRAAKTKGYAEALCELKAEQEAYKNELRERARIDALVAAVHDGSDVPAMNLAEVVELARFEKELSAICLRSPNGPPESDRARMREDARWARRETFSLWAFNDCKGRRAIALCHIKKPHSKVIGFYADEQAVRDEAAANGWFMTENWDLSGVADAELRKGWRARSSAKRHRFWSTLSKLR